MRKVCEKNLMQKHSFLYMSIVSYACSNVPNGCQSEQERQCMYNIKLRCIHVTTVAVEKQ